MKELIPVTRQALNETETLTCDARALHAFVESKQDFSTWIKSRIAKYGFIEGVDFLLHKFVEQADRQDGRGGHNKLDYTLSVDMAKQLAMVENNDKGAEVRRYFIQCEQIAKGAAATGQSGNSSAAITARSVATSYRMLARMKDVYPPEMLAIFAAKAVTVLTGEAIQPLLPPLKESHDTWLSPTEIGKRLNISGNAVGRLLKSLGLHGVDDPERKHSYAVWNKSQSSDKQVVSYVYNPAVILPRLNEALAAPEEAPAS